jgi:hypothetical protein
VELFFRYYHVSFPNLFHPPSFKASVADGSVPRVLFFGIAGLSARYSSHPSVACIHAWRRGDPYTEEAARLLDLTNVSLTSIQACVLLGIAAATQGEPASESVYFSIAFRMALILDLPNAGSDSAIGAEINNRGQFCYCPASPVSMLTSYRSMVVFAHLRHVELSRTLHTTDH